MEPRVSYINDAVNECFCSLMSRLRAGGIPSSERVVIFATKQDMCDLEPYSLVARLHSELTQKDSISVCDDVLDVESYFLGVENGRSDGSMSTPEAIIYSRMQRVEVFGKGNAALDLGKHFSYLGTYTRAGAIAIPRAILSKQYMKN
jgi:hypothetical protein